MKTSRSTKQQQQIVRELSPQFLGISGAIAQITKSLDKPAPIIPFKMPEDIFLSTVERGGTEVRIQVEIEEYCPPVREEYEQFGEGLIQEEWDAEVGFGKVYTADARMLDVELTAEERARIGQEYIKHKEDDTF